MTLRVSTGLTNGMLVTGSLKSLLEGTPADGFFIDIYTGSRPATPDTGATGTKLLTLTVGSVALAGLHLAATAAAGAVSKLATETWSGVGLAAGTAGYYRVRTGADTGGADSTTAMRLDGTVASSGADMNMTNTTVAVGAPYVVSSVSFTLPSA